MQEARFLARCAWTNEDRAELLMHGELTCFLLHNYFIENIIFFSREDSRHELRSVGDVHKPDHDDISLSSLHID
jgi:hypothetical protein